MKKWEYAELCCNSDSIYYLNGNQVLDEEGYNVFMLNMALNYVGKSGWELVMMEIDNMNNHVYRLKRELI